MQPRWGRSCRRMLNDLGEAHPSVGEVRSIGLFGIIELVRDRQTKEPMAPWNGIQPRDDGLPQILPWIMVYSSISIGTRLLIIPPLIITEEQLAEGFAVSGRSAEDHR